MYNFHTSSIPVIIEFIHIYTIHTVHTEYFYLKKINKTGKLLDCRKIIFLSFLGNDYD